MDINNILDSQQIKRLERIERDFPCIREELKGIYQKHEQNVKCKDDGGTSQLEEIESELLKLIGNHPYIYQITSRVKGPKSLIRKIIKKLYEGKKIYRHIDKDNYNKILTDLIGLRIIHKFRDEWKDINNLIMDCFFQGEDKYISDYLMEYDSGSEYPFLVEKPVVNHLPDDDLSMYKEIETKAGKSLFVYKPQRGYRSVHYIINYRGVYCEIQVRTLSDELWGEIEHDYVYKQEISSLKDKLSDAADLLRVILSAGDAVGMYMKEQIHGHEDTAEKYLQLCCRKIDDASEKLKKQGGV